MNTGFENKGSLIDFINSKSKSKALGSVRPEVFLGLFRLVYFICIFFVLFLFFFVSNETQREINTVLPVE